MADHHPWARTSLTAGLFIGILGGAVSGIIANSVGVVSFSSCNHSRHAEALPQSSSGQIAQPPSVDNGHVRGGPQQESYAHDLAQVTALAPLQGTIIAETVNRPTLVGIAPGSFLMGSNPQERGTCQNCQDEVLHRVRIGYPFYVAESEITQGQFGSVMGRNPAPAEHVDQKKPVGNISLLDAIEYCNRLSALEGFELCYSKSDDGPLWNKTLECKGYRLPTEAEWEYFARAGEWNLYAGSDDPDKVAWFNRGMDDGPERVKTKQPNAWGLYDLSGNLAEWVWDSHGSYTVGESEVLNPLRIESTSENTALTVIRGGAWYDQDFRIRVSNRQGYDYSEVAAGHGFRIVRSNL